jgi:hypothetical protein
MTAAPAPAPGVAPPAPATLAATVLFVRWEGEPGTGPILDDALAARLRAALDGWDAKRRLVLEAPQGLVVTGPVTPSVAREAARRLTRDDGLPKLRTGLHQGELRVTRDRSVQARVSGEALHAAAAAADASGDERIGMTPAFAGALAAQKRAARRDLLAGVGLLAVLGSGYAAREALGQYEAGRRPAVIQLDIRPWGDVFVDGEPKGRTPPLVRLSLPPGPHVIEVRNGRFKPLRMDVTLQAAEELELKHVFSAPPTPPRRKQQPSVLDRLKFW